MSADRRLHVHVFEASGLPQGKSSLLSGCSSGVLVAVKVDGNKQRESGVVEAQPTADWNFRTECRCPPGAARLDLEVRRPGLLGRSTALAGCSLQLPELTQPLEGETLPLFLMDGSGARAGSLRVSVHWIEPDGAGLAPPALGLQSRGLVNQAAPRALPAAALQSQETPGTGLLSSRSTHSNTIGFSSGGGLTNQAGSASNAGSGLPGALTNMAPAMTNLASSASSGATAASSTASMAPTGSLLNRGSSMGLANLADAAEDGTRQNALPRAEELLAELADPGFDPQSEAQRQKLQQALENLRCVPAAALRGRGGQEAIAACSGHIQAIFDHALASGNERERQSALWLAGRLPHSHLDDETRAGHADLQDTLRRRWDAAKMAEAFDRGEGLLREASRSTPGLEAFMDSLELAEFHAQQAADAAGSAGRARAEELLAKLRPPLAEHFGELLRKGEFQELETALGVLGNARIFALRLRGIQQELQRLRSLELIQKALLPAVGQVGFPVLKARQLRHAVMMMQAALADDSDDQAANALRAVMINEAMPACLAHSDESMAAAIRTAFDLRLGDLEVWSGVERMFETSDRQRQEEMSSSLPELCKSLGKPLPTWLLDKLRAMYRLPEGWDVAHMASQGARKLLAKTPVSDTATLRLFQEILTRTAQPEVRTRDRRGAVPRRFTAVRAVQVMNAANWQTYLHRRDEIARECRGLSARYDDAHWQDNLNGHIMSMFIKDAMAGGAASEPLLREVNEVWLLHGTSHVAAEGITSEDFDMTRANPMGLFGAGVYFGESVSKADEYVEGRMEGGQELFPLLLCRVSLGYVYYCDERRPDRPKLVDRCVRQEWHSVIGDRKKTSGTFREFIVYDNLQAFPAYIIYYARHF